MYHCLTFFGGDPLNETAELCLPQPGKVRCGLLSKLGQPDAHGTTIDGIALSFYPAALFQEPD